MPNRKKEIKWLDIKIKTPSEGKLYLASDGCSLIRAFYLAGFWHKGADCGFPEKEPIVDDDGENVFEFYAEIPKGKK